MSVTVNGNDTGGTASGLNRISPFTPLRPSFDPSAIDIPIANLTPQYITPEFTDIGSAPELQTANRPDLTPITFTMPPTPTPFNGSLSVDDILPEPFDGEAPVLNFGPAPEQDYGLAPTAPGVSLVYEEPTLSVSLPAPPNLLAITVKPFGGIDIPSIDFTIPELTAIAPSVQQYIPGEKYTSSLLTYLAQTLQNRIQNGGTGLPPAVENALWDRGREREARTMRDQLDDLDRYEGLGYALPPGVWLDARLKVATENAYANMGLSREIMIKMAELEQANILKALDGSIALESKLIDYANQIEQRAFEAVRYATEASIAVYNAKVQAYAAYVDAYKAKVAIYEAQVRAELAKVEGYKAEISAEQAKAEVNNALVNQFKVLTDAALSNIDIFKARIEGIRLKAEIEQLKVAIYGEQVKAYNARINAYTATVEGYRAVVSAEATKQEAFKAEVQAYAVQVDAAAKVIDAKISEYQALLAAKTAEYDAFKAQVQGETSRVQGQSTIEQSKAEIYKADVQAASSYNEALTQQWEAQIRLASAQAEIGITAAKANADQYIAIQSIVTDATKAAAQVQAQVAAAAIGTVNYSRNFSEQNSTSESIGASASLSAQFSSSV